MKKNFLFVIVLLSIFTGFTACNFTITDNYGSQELRQPDIEEIASGVAIRLPVPRDPVTSILIYRYEENGENKSEETSAKSIISRSVKDEKLEKANIIGYIDVEKLQLKDEFTYFFEDKSVEQHKKYEYKVRYTYKDSTKRYTKWSKQIETQINHNGFTISAEQLEVTFIKDNMELDFPSTLIEKEEDNYLYSMIIRAKPNKNEEKYITQLFAITAPVIYLTKILPRTFLEAEGGVWIDGLIKNEFLSFTTEKLPTKIGFSKKIYITIDGQTSTDEEGIQLIDEKITYDDNSSGIDFSKQIIKHQ